MKTIRLKYLILAAFAALLFIPTLCFAAATNVLFEPTGTATMTDGAGGNQTQTQNANGTWQNWFINSPGITNFNINWDNSPAGTPPTGAASSIKQSQGWDGTAGATLTTYACFGGNNFWGGPYLDATAYTNIEMDFKYDTTSDLTPATNGHFLIVVGDNFRASSGGVTITNIQNRDASAYLFDGAWHHLKIPLNPAILANCVNSKGPGFSIFNPATTTGGFNYWVANLTMNAGLVAIPPPSLTFQGTSPGLWQFADVTPNYNRQDLRTTTTPVDASKNIDWVGHPGAAYSWTVSQFPGPGHDNFQMALTLTPDPAETMTYSDPDWSSTNALWFQIQANADGTARSFLAWKTNQPSNNTQLNPNTGSGSLFANLQSPTAVGTWTVAFPDDTHVTVTTPGGVVTNVTLPAAMFSAMPYTNISASLYTGMNADANVGEHVTLTSYHITGVTAPVNEDLTDGVLDTPFLTLQSQQYGANANPPNQVFVTSADKYWLHWTLPDAGFGLIQKTSLTNTYWLDYSPGAPFINGQARWVKIPTASLPNPNISFLALIQRTNSQLQVLLPGESPAPNTPTGKTGTPTPLSLGVDGGLISPVIVRAVDATWNLVNSTDTIHLTTSDGTALNLPANTAMTNGIVVFDSGSGNFLQFGSAGTFTVTATNISRVMPAATSSPVTVNQ